MNASTAIWHPLPEAYRKIAAAYPNAVLLETAKPDKGGERSLLFLKPLTTIAAREPEDMYGLLAEVECHLAEGRFVAGYFTYESGEPFVGLKPRKDAPDPLAWLGVYALPIEFHHRTGVLVGSLPDDISLVTKGSPEISIGSADMEITKAEYLQKISRVQDYLRSGDTYQVNYTDRISGSYNGKALSLFEELLKQQPVSFAAFINRPEGALLSLSPELFYRTSRRRITARPMKGTWPRGLDLAGDESAAEQLRNDLKNRSEHVTIVDLLRNDLGRVCELGSVEVDELFHVERYRTLLQMTSTISGRVHSKLTPTQIFRSLFPSGSITGAPKRRTMEIIRELERHPRGAYTGAIGYFAPGGEACFNVAIRTLEVTQSAFTMGVGGGTTADSLAEDEYEECRLKGSFLTQRRPSFSLIETMRCDGGSIALLSLHMERLAASAEYFDIRFKREALLEELQQVVAVCGETVSRVRLELNEEGRWTIAANPLEDTTWSGKLLLSAQRSRSDDVFLRHKTTNRGLYQQQFAVAQGQGFDEVLFTNERGELTEGAISNVFVRQGDRWYTPSLACGVLPGIQRTLLVEKLTAEETTLTLATLQEADEVAICNALRGVRSVRQIQSADNTPIFSSTAPE